MPDQEYLAAREEAWNKLSTNPRWMVALPSEKTCRRCHNGKIHYKTKIFLADCQKDKDFENCVKCHPLMTKEYFEQHRKDREALASGLNNETDRSQGRAVGAWPSHLVNRSAYNGYEK